MTMVWTNIRGSRRESQSGQHFIVLRKFPSFWIGPVISQNKSISIIVSLYFRLPNSISFLGPWWPVAAARCLGSSKSLQSDRRTKPTHGHQIPLMVKRAQRLGLIIREATTTFLSLSAVIHEPCATKCRSNTDWLSCLKENWLFFHFRDPCLTMASKSCLLINTVSKGTTSTQWKRCKREISYIF